MTDTQQRLVEVVELGIDADEQAEGYTVGIAVRRGRYVVVILDREDGEQTIAFVASDDPMMARFMARERAKANWRARLERRKGTGTGSATYRTAAGAGVGA